MTFDVDEHHCVSHVLPAMACCRHQPEERVRFLLSSFSPSLPPFFLPPFPLPPLHCLSFLSFSLSPQAPLLLLGCEVMFDSATSQTTARQASLSFTISWSLLKLMSIESVIPSNYLILCCPFLILSPIIPASDTILLRHFTK